MKNEDFVFGCERLNQEGSYEIYSPCCEHQQHHRQPEVSRYTEEKVQLLTSFEPDQVHHSCQSADKEL